MKLWMTLLALCGYISLNSQTVTLNFADPDDPNYVATWGANARACLLGGIPVDTTNCLSGGAGVWAMWAGNTNGDDVIDYTGASGASDRTPLTSGILLADGNLGLFSLSFIVTGVYSNADTNLDGNLDYTGAANPSDRTPITRAIQLHPGNTTFSLSFLVKEQLPEN